MKGKTKKKPDDINTFSSTISTRPVKNTGFNSIQEQEAGIYAQP